MDIQRDINRECYNDALIYNKQNLELMMENDGLKLKMEKLKKLM